MSVKCLAVLVQWWAPDRRLDAVQGLCWGVQRAMGPERSQAPQAPATILPAAPCVGFPAPSNLAVSVPSASPKLRMLVSMLLHEAPWLSAASGDAFTERPGTRVLVPSKLVLETFRFLYVDFVLRTPHPKSNWFP